MRGSQKPIKEQPPTSKRQTQQEEEAQESSAGGKGTIYQSPDVRGSSKFYTPAEQLKFQSPEMREVRT
jgi:hypothetical protein